MRLKALSEKEILEIDDCALSLSQMTGVLQVYAGYARSMRRLPELSPDGSLVVLADVAGSFIKKCFEAFDAGRFPYEHGKIDPDLAKVESIDRRSARSLERRSVFKLKIFKIGAFLSFKYRVVLEISVGGSILRFADYEAASAPEIFSVVRKALH